MTEICIWKIRIAGYGDYEFEGTKEEAEEERKRKALWERAPSSQKYRITNQRESDKLIEKQCSLFDKYGYAPLSLGKKIAKQLKKEQI